MPLDRVRKPAYFSSASGWLASVFICRPLSQRFCTIHSQPASRPEGVKFPLGCTRLTMHPLHLGEWRSPSRVSPGILCGPASRSRTRKVGRGRSIATGDDILSKTNLNLKRRWACRCYETAFFRGRCERHKRSSFWQRKRDRNVPICRSRRSR